ncbi:MAG: hypothetical protein NVSMB21_09820 [Vulcanimicrobiaceae bacterium]
MNRLFFCAFLLSIVATPFAASASPLARPLGSATATLALDPDPPVTGTAHATLDLVGAPPADLATTTISYGTEMTSMHMAGGSGVAHRVSPGHYTFELSFGMADAWGVTIHAKGGVNGNAAFSIPVTAPSASGKAASSMKQGSSTPSRPSDSMGSMKMGTATTSQASGGSAASMPGMAMGSSGSGGDAGPWRTAALILLAIVIIGAVLSRRVRTPWAYAVLGVAGAVAIAVAALQVHVDAQPGSMNGMDINAMTDVKGDAPVAVRTVALARAAASSDPAVYAPGTLAPYLLQDIVARSPGVLEDFTTYAGDRVGAGQVLAHLSEPELAARAGASSADANAQSHAADAAAIDAASRAPANVVVSRAAASAAKIDAEGAAADVVSKNERRRYWTSELARERSLLHEGAVSQQEYQDERAQAAAADAEATMAYHRLHAARENATAADAKILDAAATAQIARANAAAMRAQAEKAAASARVDAVMVGYATVVAPMDGVVLKRMVDPGTYVQAGTVIARVAVIDRLRVQANIADTDLPGVTVGTPITAKTGDGVTLRGRVSSVAPVADPSTRTAAVEAIVENPGHRAVVGGYVRVTLETRSTKLGSSLRVPSSAIVTGTEHPAVWRVTDRTAERVPVRVVSDDGRDAYITGSLHPGDRIVVDGAPSLQQGAHVSEAST